MVQIPQRFTVLSIVGNYVPPLQQKRSTDGNQEARENQYSGTHPNSPSFTTSFLQPGKQIADAQRGLNVENIQEMPPIQFWF